MASDFEQGLMTYLNSADSPPSNRALKKWLEANPKGPMRRTFIKRLNAQADAMVAADQTHGNAMFGSRTYGSFTAIDWQKLLTTLSPFLKLLLSLLVG